MISIIIPIYNVSSYLVPCVNSVVSQTYTDTEIILVDDGSPDDCPDICDEYAVSDERIIAIHKPNGGQSSARNRGLDIAAGEFINFIDGDDYIAPEMLCILWERLVHSDAEICMCGYNRIDQAGNKYYVTACNNAEYSKNDAFRLLLQGNVNFVVVWGKLYKKCVFSDLRFKEGVIHEDEYIAYRIINNCNKILSIADSYYQYVIRGSSTMGQDARTVNGYKISIDISVDRIHFFEEKEVDEFLCQATALALNEFNVGLTNKKVIPKEVMIISRDRLRKVIRVRACLLMHVRLLLKVVLFKLFFPVYSLLIRKGF